MALLAVTAIGCHGTAREADVDPQVHTVSTCVGGASTVSVPVAGNPTFGTYNVHWLRDAAGVRRDLARLDAVTAWAFQEVRCAGVADEHPTAPPALREVLPPGVWHVAWVPLNRLRELGSDDFECQAIVSRHPIRFAEVWPLPSPVGGKRRVALAAVLDVNGVEMRFVNADHEPSILSPARRNVVQVRQLLRAVARHEDGGRPVVIAGDFNTAGCVPRFVSARADRAELCRLMSAAGFEAALPPNRRTFRAGPYAATLDHVFVRGAALVNAGIDERAAGSDHRPLWCRIAPPVTGTASASRTASPAAP